MGLIVKPRSCRRCRITIPAYCSSASTRGRHRTVGSFRSNGGFFSLHLGHCREHVQEYSKRSPVVISDFVCSCSLTGRFSTAHLLKGEARVRETSSVSSVSSVLAGENGEHSHLTLPLPSLSAQNSLSAGKLGRRAASPTSQEKLVHISICRPRPLTA